MEQQQVRQQRFSIAVLLDFFSECFAQKSERFYFCVYRSCSSLFCGKRGMGVRIWPQNRIFLFLKVVRGLWLFKQIFLRSIDMRIYF